MQDGSAVPSGAIYGPTVGSDDTEHAAPRGECSVCLAPAVPGVPLCLTHLRVVVRIKHGATPEPPRRHPRVHDPIVYYVLFGDRVKIGTTTNLTERLQAVPHDEVLATEPGSYDVERQRHQQFDAYRVSARSEWFHHHPALAVHIATLT